MSRGIEVRNGSQVFGTKGKAANECRRILREYQGRRVEGPDARFVLNLLLRYAKATKKIGTGLSHFEVRRVAGAHGRGASYCFFVCRQDGSAEDFSYDNCLTEPHPEQAVLYAMREAVADQLAECRVASGITDCPVVAHHDGVSFDELARRWAAEEGLALATIGVADAQGCTAKIMADTEMRTRWAEYHRRNATLLAMRRDEHERLGRAQSENA